MFFYQLWSPKRLDKKNRQQSSQQTRHKFEIIPTNWQDNRPEQKEDNKPDNKNYKSSENWQDNRTYTRMYNRPNTDTWPDNRPDNRPDNIPDNRPDTPTIYWMSTDTWYLAVREQLGWKYKWECTVSVEKDDIFRKWFDNYVLLSARFLN